MKDLVTEIAKALVDIPGRSDGSRSRRRTGYGSGIAGRAEDLGKVIGKQGRTARSIRTLLGAAGMKLNRRFTLEILE